MSDDPQALAQAYADHAAMQAADLDWPAAAENYQAAADVCRTEDRRLRQAALARIDEPTTCGCSTPEPTPLGDCRTCHRLIT